MSVTSGGVVGLGAIAAGILLGKLMAMREENPWPYIVGVVAIVAIIGAVAIFAGDSA